MVLHDMGLIRAAAAVLNTAEDLFEGESEPPTGDVERNVLRLVSTAEWLLKQVGEEPEKPEEPPEPPEPPPGPTPSTRRRER